MITYRHVVEIGSGDSFSSEGLKWCTHAEAVSLYEPYALLWADLNRAAAGLDNVTVRRAAVSDIGGNWPLIHLGYASYLVGEPSFYATSIEPEGEPFIARLKRAVEVVTVNQVVSKDVDLLILTPNGADMRILRAMTARPKIIQTKHMVHNARQGEEFAKVYTWMQHRGYAGRRLTTNLHGTLQHVEWRLDTAGQFA
jgi:hypothetical protein